MSQFSPAFAFPCPSEPQVLAAARSLAALIGADQFISRAVMNATMREHFGGSDAEGRWSVRDAHAVLELAQVLFLADESELVTAVSPELADQTFSRLDALVPSQTTRSDEQIEWQQFATPPRIAWLAARACAMSAGELVLEPSAGTGMLSIWAAKTGARLALNEISPLRRDCLGAMFPDAIVTGYDGELIDELLSPNVAPSVVLMNPPYSHGIERGHDGRTGARHLRSAWKRLLPGGRLVAVMPEWFDLSRFLNGITGPVALWLNAAIERGFVKQGTSITTRLLVLDKADGGSSPVIAKPVDFAELCDLVGQLPDRAGQPAEPIIVARPSFSLRLAPKPSKPVPRVVRPVAAVPSIQPLVYQPLEAPAPMAEQVGHYLPYRPSRIAITGAADHPTPLVESVAMGSITAPVPEAVPQLPSELIARGVLSAAQAETLIYAASAHTRDLGGRFEPEDKGCLLKPSAEGRTYRMGYFLGDGTGAGKGRQVASVILDRWVRGERRHIWISKNEALLEDARRDWTALGGLPIDVQPLGQWKLGAPIGMREGIIFVTYPTLRSGRSDATRLKQILEWAGDDFDGVIVFDEAHAMANAAGGEGSRGKVKGSELDARDRMIEQLCALPPIATALDAIIERFGTDQVAEVTGRTRRLIVGRDGRQQLQSRSPRANVAETQAFMDGSKKVLVFSDAGGTGRSYHADLSAKNQARRVHFLLEPGWRADAAIQGLGRTNRTNQASAPLFRPVTTDVRGERRFISTIARRLDSLGALTRGQRQTGGQNLFDPADNLESSYAKEALHRWFGLLFTGKLDAVGLARFEELTGLRIEGSDGSMVDDLPTIQRWLNRIPVPCGSTIQQAIGTTAPQPLYRSICRLLLPSVLVNFCEGRFPEAAAEGMTYLPSR